MVTRHYVGIIRDEILPYPRITVIRSTNFNTLSNRLTEIVVRKSELDLNLDWYCGYKDITTDEEISEFDREIENLTKITHESLDDELFTKLTLLINRIESDGELFEFDINVKDNDRGKWRKIDYTNKEYVTCATL